MDVGSVIGQLIEKDISFPALKLVLDNQVDLRCTSELPKITPSHYLRENGLTTDERLALLCKQQRRMSCWRPGNDVVVEPAIIVFQNYNSGDTLKVPINIRNTSRMSQKVVILMDESSIFQLDKCSQRVAKFPCGMAIAATINFYPEYDRDYYHKLVIHTNTGRFAIPIVCIGGRGLLNAPDSLVFERSPVKFMTTKTVPLYNNGRKPARFTLSTTGPFCVSPEQGLVPPKDSFSMNVSFYSDFLGEYDGYLVVKYENGEEVYICLRAEAVNLSISIHPKEVEFDDIYIGLPSKFVCSLTNDSDYVLDFKWKKESHAIENTLRKSVPTDSVSSGSDSQKRSEGGDTLDRVIDLLENCGDGNEDCLGVAMGLEDQLINLKNPEQLFSDESFIVEPTSGQLQPRSSVDIYVIFTPQRPAIHNVTPYLDISGSEERIPLTLTGRGLGPKFKFGFEALDLGVVFFDEAHTYEIPVLNVGAIPGKVVFDKVMGLSPNTPLSMKVEPRKLDLEPDEHGAFYVSFHCAAKTGSFEDEIKFIVPRTKEQVYVAVRGSICYLHCQEEDLEFNDVSNSMVSIENKIDWLADEEVQLDLSDPNSSKEKKDIKKSKKKKDNVARQPYVARKKRSRKLSDLPEPEKKDSAEAKKNKKPERPRVVFSRKSLSFRIDATPTLEVFEQKETITVENRGPLSLSVLFKTSHPFSIMHEKISDGCLTELSHDFESGDSVKLTLVFDIRSVSRELSQFVYESLLEAIYINHPGREDSILLRGEVNFPTLSLEKIEVNFGTIVNGTEAVEELRAVNEGPHPLTYKWHIMPGTTMIARGRRQAQLDRDFLGSSSEATQESEVSFKDLTGPRTTAISRMTADSIALLPLNRDYYGRTTSCESLDGYDQSVQVERMKLQRARLMDIVGLEDPEEEYEDEYNYLAHHIPEAMERDIFVNEIVDIIPMAGIVPAGTTQTFSVVFYGHNDTNFQTTAFCHIEGGTGVSFIIRGISAPRPASIIRPPDTKTMSTSSKTSLATTVRSSKEKDALAKKSKPKPKKKPKKKDKRKQPCNPNEAGDSRISPDTLQLFGSCVPAISNDPEILFQKIVDLRVEDEIYNKVYIKEEDCFDFGPTIVPLVPLKRVVRLSTNTEGEIVTEMATPTPRVKHKDNVSKFTVRNISAMPAVCTLCLVHGRMKYFEFQPEQFTVEPGAQQTVTLWAFPRVPEVVIEDHLVFCIKDNPDPIFFRVRVVGTTPRVFMEQNIVNFGKTLLNSRSVAQVSVTNTGLIPVVWQLSKDTHLPEHVYTEKIKGTIKPKSSADIRFLFKSNVPILINEAFLDIEFVDTQGILGVIDVFKLAMYGESYDVVVDILSEKKEFTLIDFGVLPVGYPIVQNIIVSNRGNYDIFFRFKVDPERLSFKNKQFTRLLKDYMLVFPTEDALESNQAAVVQIVFEPPKEMQFVNEPILTIQLVDLVMNVLVAELTIPVSVKGERHSISADDHHTR